ncbi:stromal cell-derived factor 2-like [Halyomorpha halys]|uniref:stromal cell-derived factor 2-like n=1 Tax=Halyomorpha halys TaxID=286706 RepID=UPI0006D515BD
MLSLRIILAACIVAACIQMSCNGTTAVYVTFGSVVKLMNIAHGTRLHSISELKYIGGSSQQMVTGTYDGDDMMSNWVVKSEGVSTRGQPVQCGDTVRLMHLASAKNLHSHTVRSPLSGNLEVTAFGENGVGDGGDSWQVMCKRLLWRRDSPVLLRHRDTGSYLMVSGERYDDYYVAVADQLEVAATHLGHQSYWQVAEGFYVHPSKFRNRHSEL